MTVQPYQADTKRKHGHMNCRDCIKLPLGVDGIDDSIDTQIMKTTRDLLVHLAALDNVRNPDIVTPKKVRGGIFSECFAENFKAKFLCYVNEVLFEMVKISLNDTYLGGTTPTALQNEVSTCRIFL